MLRTSTRTLQRSNLESRIASRLYSSPANDKPEQKVEREPSSTSSSPPPPSPPPPPSAPNEPSFTSSLSRASAEANLKPLPYLSTPLGVPSPPPKGGKLSWTERRENYFDPEVRNQRRKAIVKEATRGYFHDFHNLRSHGGKTWRSAMTLIKEEKALYFPNISGTCLLDRKTKHTADMLPGKVSIVSILSSKISEEHTKSFYEPTLEAFSDNKDFQLVQINLQPNPLKSYLLSLFLSSLRSQIAPSLHPTYLLSSNSLELEKEALGLHNKHVGYVYLVGRKGEIRWAGGAFAEREEREALRNCTSVLLNRNKDSRR